MEAAAKNKFNTDTNCYSVNNNDNLGSIFFYNAKVLGLSATIDSASIFLK